MKGVDLSFDMGDSDRQDSLKATFEA